MIPTCLQQTLETSQFQFRRISEYWGQHWGERREPGRSIIYTVGIIYPEQFEKPKPFTSGLRDGCLSVCDRVAYGQISLRRYEDREEDWATEGDVVERVGQLRDQINPHQAVAAPGPFKYWYKRMMIMMMMMNIMLIFSSFKQLQSLSRESRMDGMGFKESAQVVRVHQYIYNHNHPAWPSS